MARWPLQVSPRRPGGRGSGQTCSVPQDSVPSRLHTYRPPGACLPPSGHRSHIPEGNEHRGLETRCRWDRASARLSQGCLSSIVTSGGSRPRPAQGCLGPRALRGPGTRLSADLAAPGDAGGPCPLAAQLPSHPSSEAAGKPLCVRQARGNSL